MIDLLPDPRSPAAPLIGIPEESTPHHAGLLSVCGASATGARWRKTHTFTHSHAHTKEGEKTHTQTPKLRGTYLNRISTTNMVVALTQIHPTHKKK